MYAIVNISGKQYKAEKGSKLCVPKQHLDEGKNSYLKMCLWYMMVNQANSETQMLLVLK